MLLWLVVGACDRPVPTDRENASDHERVPTAPLPPLRLTTACSDPVCVTPDRPWSQFVSIGVGTLTAVDSSAAVFAFPQRTLVRLTVIGRIQRQYNPLIPPSWNLAGLPYPSLDANGERIGGDRGGDVYTAFQGTGASNIAAIGPAPNAPSPGLLDSFSVVGVVRGSGPVRRRAFLQPSYPGPPACNGLTGIRCVIAISGQQVVRIEIVSNGQLTLSASPAEVIAGGSVTFTASAGSLPLTVHEWIWRSDAGAAPQAMVMSQSTAPVTHVSSSAGQAAQTSAASCQAGQSTCTIPVYEPGVMWVRATVGSGTSASIQAASAPAAAFPAVTCPTGDSLLDLPATRELLKAVTQRTETLVPKVEWAGYVYKLPDGSHRFEMDVNAQNTCNGASARVSANAGWTPVLSVHSHPAVPKSPLCNGKADYGPHRGILSPQDWDATDLNWGTPPVVPVAVIDPKTIAIGRTGVWSDREPIYNSNGQQVGAARFPTKSQFDSAYSSFPRRSGSCERP